LGSFSGDILTFVILGGQKFTTSKATLLQYKGSYFEELICNQQGDSAEVFIDRDPAFFGMVLNFLRNGGKMLLDELRHSQIKAFMQELRFYRLPEDSLQKISGTTLLSVEHAHKVNTWLPGRQLTLIYKATKDGFAAADFHQKCDGKGPTLTVIKSTGGHLFGGYTSKQWSSAKNRFGDDSAFLFTLTNPHNIPPTKYSISGSDAIYDEPTYHATFGGGHDIRVYSNAHQNQKSYSVFPHSYDDTTGKGNTTFTGTDNFTVADIEVFSVV